MSDIALPGTEYDGFDIVGSRECDEVVVVRVTCLGSDLVGVVDEIDDRLDRLNEQRRIFETCGDEDESS